MKLKPLLTEETTKNAGKIRYEIRGKTDDLLEFMYLEQVSDITVRFVETDRLVRVMLEIGDQTGYDDIRDAIPSILRWRDEVQEKQADKIAFQLFQGIPKPSNKEEMLESLSFMQERGMRYAELVEKFNELLSQTAIKIARYRRKKSMSTEELIEMNLLIQLANGLLFTIGLKDVDIQFALDEIAAGRPPFEKGYPVTRRQMITALQNWRKREPHIRVKNALEKVRKHQGGQV